jgi:4'-phosphopantetheinyl transferase
MHPRRQSHCVRPPRRPPASPALTAPRAAVQVVAQMMPLLMMRHRRVPRAMWRDRQTSLGKHWIEQEINNMTQDKYHRSMIGYSLAHQGSLVGMAMVQGAQREVINIGFAVRKMAVEPAEVSVGAYVESQSHKVRPPAVSMHLV